MKQVLLVIVLLNDVTQISVASIVGVTYMDHFDFEQRYRDVNECNPLYWHPLHLPEACMHMFEKLIRSGLKTFSPYRIVQETSSPSGTSEVIYPYYNYMYSPVNKVGYEPVYHPVERNQSPFEVMFELLRRDVSDLPSAPSLGISPYLGVIAMYKQPVSYKSVAMIKKLAKAYGKAAVLSTAQTDANYKKEDKKKISSKVTNGSVVVDKVVESSDAITYFNIKKLK